MQTTHTWRNILATGLALFSMFFGAGNVVFPLAIGQMAESQNIFAILGLLITAVGVTFLGLIAMSLYDGDYKSFFSRLGNKTGFVIALLIMGLIGPFGALPRCIALSHATTDFFFPGIPLPWFSFFAVIVIFLLTIRRSSIVDILGYFLTPFLLITLGVIVVKGLLFHPETTASNNDAMATFLTGLKEGYQMMDLLGAFFFSSVVILGIKKDLSAIGGYDHKKMINFTLKASFVAAILLSLVYIGFSFVSALHNSELAAAPKDQLIAQISLHILGPYAGLVACAAVALATLTTAIALAAVSAEFVHTDISQGRISYGASLIGTLVISYFISTLNFSGIIHFLAPILEVLYPALILLSILNILHKLYGIKTVKGPVLALFLATLAFYAWQFLA
ncbi:MAG: branched-chain amino acid transport system II carrier protein [Parachlamydiaceae bacterium]